MKKLLVFFLVVPVTLFILFLPKVNSQSPCDENAGYVGGEVCGACHEEIVRDFSVNIHNRQDCDGIKNADCECCHGPAAEHVAGDRCAIINPAKLPCGMSTRTCLECHSKDKYEKLWRGSVHDVNGLGCITCHKVHGGHEKLLKTTTEIDLCFSCHYDIRASIMKRSKHPLRDSAFPSGEGKMKCSSCHNPHGTITESLIDARSVNDKCYECHQEKKAPLLWEHSPVKENCLVCHTPHGSSNDKLLVAKIPRLCQQCHLQGRHQTGALGVNSVFAFNRGCLNCHPMVHGSNNPSGAVLQR